MNKFYDKIKLKVGVSEVTFENLENLRKKLRDLYLLSFCISAIIIILLFFFFGSDGFTSVISIIIMIFIPILITHKSAREYKLEFKNFFVKSALTKLFTNLTYEPENGIDRSIIANTQMMNMGDRYTSNDYISGKYKNIGFTQADVHIEEKRETRDSDGNRNTYWVTLFKGRWMIFDFNKTFKANVQVCQKFFGNNKVGGLFSTQKYQKVKMESAIFNKAFKVYAQNEHDAFYILTPSLMEKIQKLDQKNKGKLLLCFIDNKLHVGIYDNKDSFEHGSVWVKINQEKTTQSIASDIEKITMFVDDLNLENDLFRREV